MLAEHSVNAFIPTLPAPKKVLEWIGVLAASHALADERDRAPEPSDRMYSLIEDATTEGTVYSCSYGNTFTLAFKGTLPFITRWYNWAVNSCTVSANVQLNWYLGRPHDNRTISLAYICPKTRDDVLRGLARQFRWEIIRDREVEPLEDRWDEETGPVLVYDESRIEKLVKERAEQFLADHVEIDSNILARTRDIGPVYDVSPQSGRAESNWGVGNED